MKPDKLTMTLLFDFYGELLTEKQQTCFDLYYNQDYSLSEIAEMEGISRQGVHDAVARAETALTQLEQTTRCVETARRLDAALRTVSDCAEALRRHEDPEIRRQADRILTAIAPLKE